MSGRRRFLFGGVAAAAAAMLRFGPVAALSPVAGRKAGRVVVIGGGFAGSACALHLRRLDPRLQVTLVDPDDRYVTCPMSNSVITEMRPIASITVSRRGLAHAGVTYAHDRCSAVEPEQKVVRLRGGQTLPYDRLVFAPGIRLLWGTPAGYDEAAAQLMPHAWIAGAQTRLLADQLRRMPDGGVLAISVPAGPMRCPPGPFERASLMAAFLKAHKPRAKILIFDANNHFPKQDTFTAAWQRLYPGMIEWIPVVADGAIVRVDPSKLTLHGVRDAHTVDVANIIPPQAPAMLAVDCGLASERGWCRVDPRTFESVRIPCVHVIGDACIADPMPKSGSAANAQARQCARAIVAALGGSDLEDAPLDSVCYSLLAPGMALSIHGHFRTAAGVIQQLSAGAAGDEPAMASEAAAAESWYRGIVADSFG